MKVVVGSDHGGFELKEILKKHLEDKGIDVTDVGAYDTNSVDYPDIAVAACAKVTSGECSWGVLVCGTGIGISMAANKVSGIRCALVGNEYSAEMTKRHNNANMLAFGGRVTGPDLAKNILDAYINAEFEGGRHQKRIDKISAIEG
ncbi:MAG: ribose 5-phosphate isomerase B [Clostridia bacterium]|nr:ribose 5-phosphate isomerase B [Clostridia bacterium]